MGFRGKKVVSPTLATGALPRRTVGVMDAVFSQSFCGTGKRDAPLSSLHSNPRGSFTHLRHAAAAGERHSEDQESETIRVSKVIFVFCGFCKTALTLSHSE